MRSASRIIMAVLIVALAAAAIGAYSFVTSVNSTIQLIASRPGSGSSSYTGYYTFPGLANIDVEGACQPSTNDSSATCDLTVGVALSTNASEVNYGLATKSITVELVGSRLSQIAALSYLNSDVLNVQYHQDNLGDVSATVYTPALYGGSTWNFEFMIINAPTNSTGQVNLNLVVSSELVHTGTLGHNYDIQVHVGFPIHACALGPLCI